MKFLVGAVLALAVALMLAAGGPRELMAATDASLPASSKDRTILGLVSLFLFLSLVLHVTAQKLIPTGDSRRNSYLTNTLCLWILPMVRSGKSPDFDAWPDWPADANGEGRSDYSPEQFRQQLDAAWKRRRARGGTLFSTVWLDLMLPATLATNLVAAPIVLLNLLQPTILRWLTEFASDLSVPLYEGVRILAVAVLAEFIKSWLSYNYRLYLNRAYAPVQLALGTLITGKVARLDAAAFERADSGAIETVRKKVCEFSLKDQLYFTEANFAIANVVRLVWILCLFGRETGAVPLAAGIGALLLCSRLTRWVGHVAARQRKAYDAVCSMRGAMLQELTEYLPQWKVYGWTGIFIYRVREQTTKLASLKVRIGLLDALETVLADAPALLFGMLAVDVLVYGHTPALLPLLHLHMLSGEIQDAWAQLLAGYKESIVNCRTLLDSVEAFLLLEESTPRFESDPASPFSLTISSRPGAEDSADGANVHADGRVVQGRDAQGGVVQLPRSELVLISGNIASGKSTLIESLLNDTPHPMGVPVLRDERAAYCPQLSCFVNGTIVQNVAFGECPDAVDERALGLALEGSGLTNDFDDVNSTMHAKREHTPVGAQGGSLSGGQRAGVNLARVIYSYHAHGTKLILLDDPLPALDNESKQRAWADGVCGALGGTTRLVVMNSQLLHMFARDAHRLILVDDRRVVYNGHPSAVPPSLIQVMGEEYRLDHLFDTSKAAPSVQLRSVVHLQMRKLKAAARVGVLTRRMVRRPSEPTPHSPVRTTSSRALLEDEEMDIECASALTPPPPLPPSNLAEGEVASLPKGDVKSPPAPPNPTDPTDLTQQTKGSSTTIFGLVISVCSRGGVWWPIALLLEMSSGACAPLMLWWLPQWASDSYQLGPRGNFLAGLAIALTLLLLRFSSHAAMALVMSRFASSLYGDVERKLDGLALGYFWRRRGEPVDVRSLALMDATDYCGVMNLPLRVGQCFIALGALLISSPRLTPIALAVLYLQTKSSFTKSWFFQSVVPLAQRTFQQQRQALAEAFETRGVVRAQRLQPAFQRLYDKTAMENIYVGCLHLGAMTFQSLIDSSLQTMFTGCAIAAVAISRQSTGSGTVTAIATFTLLSKLTKTIRNALVAADLAVRRVTMWDKLVAFLADDQMEDIDSPGEPPPPATWGSWPTKGEVVFDNVTFHYNPADHGTRAIHQLSLTIAPGVKAGVIGRRGSGKSTLVNTLFCLGNLSVDEGGRVGSVSIDNVALTGLNIRKLRNRLGMVPQSPVLFSGSLRDNCSPDRSVSDDEIKAELTEFHLAEVVEQLGGLDAKLESKGMLSAGQAQLLCAVRAMLRRPKLLVLDEATSSLDHASAVLLQHTVYHNHRGTLLNIAHHLDFVKDADMIICMHNGGVQDVGSPSELLKKPDSLYAQQLRASERRLVYERNDTRSGTRHIL